MTDEQERILIATINEIHRLVGTLREEVKALRKEVGAMRQQSPDRPKGGA